ncbi:MAG TPA: right-handed parallel beta-helix repeat-containing protein [Pyrinomonadaceae bacterium]|nr:right-handed parallel beta-helix repeat-containing protein [Pyrinomonadaceae bacterium]
MSRTFTIEWFGKRHRLVLMCLGLVLIVCASCEPEITRGESGVIKVSPSQNLQSIIDRARPGDVIELEAGKVYEGPLTLPKKDGNTFITIRSSRAAELPEGVRVTPAQSALFAKLQSSEGGEPVIKTVAGAHHYRIIGLDISTATPKTVVYDLVRIGDPKQTAADVPHDFVIDRSYIHGHPTQDVQRGVATNGAEITVSNSHISEIHGRGFEAQAICGWNGPGPFRIVNNYLEGAGENIMFGGADPSIPNLIPTNIEIRGNHLFKPLSWKKSDSSYGGIHWGVKNLLEIKMGRNVIIDGNILENCWGDAQIGYAVLFTVRNQNGKAPWATIENLSFTNNIVKNSEQGFQLLGKDYPNRSEQATGLTISNNLFIDIANRFLTMSGYNNVTLTHNTHFQGGNIMSLYGDPSMGFVYTDNITNRGEKGYGLFGDGVGEGNPALARYVPGATIRNNVIIGASANNYPRQNAYPASAAEVKFVDFQNGNFRLSPQSRFKNTASDKTDPGCHFDRLPQQKKN